MLMMMAALASAAVALGQPALTKGMEGKRLDADELATARYVGVEKGMDAWVMEGRKHVKQVVLTDVNLEPVVVAPIEGSGDLELLAASPADYRTGVLLADKRSKRAVVLRGEVDADSRALVESPDTVVAFDFGRKDVCMLWAATSPSGRYTALIAVIQMSDEQQYSAYTAMFDSRMYRIWGREYALGSLHEVVATDDGRVVTLGEEREGDESHFVFNVLDSLRSTTFDAVVKCDPVQEVHLANVIGPYAVVAGTYRPAGKKNEGMTAGVLTLSFHLDSAQLAGVTLRPLQNEDLNILLNEKTKKIQKAQALDHVKQLGCVATPYGAVLALGRDMVVERSSNGGSVTRTGYGTGVMMAAVDTTGRVCWVRNLRRNDVNEEGERPTLGIAAVGNRVCVVKSEHAKMPSIYDISNEAKQMKQGDKGNVVVYAVDAEGQVEKLLLEAKSKQTVVRALTRHDGTLVYLSRTGKKSRLAELRGM